MVEEKDKLIPEELEAARAYLASIGYNLDYEQVKKVIEAYKRIRVLKRRKKAG